MKESTNFNLGHRRTSSLGKSRSQFFSDTETGETSHQAAISWGNYKRRRITQKENGNKNRKHTTLLKKICFSSFIKKDKIFGCHPRRMLRIKSNCRFMLLALLTISTLMLLFTITEFENQRYPVIQDIVDKPQDKFENIKKNFEDEHYLEEKRNADEKLRVNKKYLIHLGLPANADDIITEVFIPKCPYDYRIKLQHKTIIL